MLEKGKKLGERAVQLHHPLPVGRRLLLSISFELSVCVRRFKGMVMQYLSHPEKSKGTGMESGRILGSCRGERYMGVPWEMHSVTRGQSDLTRGSSSDVSFFFL